MGRRTSRTRADVLVAVGVLTVVALAMAVPRLQTDKIASVPTPASSLGLDGCPRPGTSAEPDAVRDRAGTFVPTGATQITLCRMVTDPTDPRVHSRVGQSRVLSGHVTEMVEHLNAMPSIAGLKWIAQAAGVRRGAHPRADQFSCTDGQHATELSFVVRYPDAEPVVVWLDENCGSATHDGRTRYGLGEALAVFYSYVRAELAAVADLSDLRPPACPPQLDPLQLDRRGASGQGRDDIATNRAPSDTFLPSSLVAATACRYAMSGAGARLQRGARVPVAAVAALGETINSQFADGLSRGFTDCGEPHGQRPLSLLDLVLVVDETGSVAEVRLVRRPCLAALAPRKAAVVPSSELLTLVDGVLGRVA